MPGSWGSVSSVGTEVASNSPPSMFALSSLFTADAAAATVPVNSAFLNYPTAFLTDVGIVFDGTTPPDSVTIQIKDSFGLVVHPNDTLTFTASGRCVLTDRPCCVGGVTVTITGNTTNSAKARVVLYFAMNSR